MDQVDLGVGSKASVYGRLGGLVVGLLVLGLLLPFVVGEPTAGNLAAGGAGRDLSGLGGSTAGTIPGQLSPGGLPAPSDGTTPDDALISGGQGRVGSGGPTSASAPGSRPGATAVQPAAPGTSPTGQPLRASDTGVAADKIRFALLIPDTGGASDAGFDVGLGDQADMIQALVDDQNARGGVNGRLLEPVPVTFDALTPEDHSAACVEANEDHKVFAGISSTAYNDAALVCFTVTYGRPFVNFTGVNNGVYAQAAGNLFSAGMSNERAGANAAAEFDRLGLFADGNGRKLKVGVIGNENNDGVTAFADTARSLGYAVHDARVTGSAAQVQAQIPIRISEMRRDGVEVVLLAMNLINSTVFVQQAEGQGWQPEYRVSDLVVMASDGAAERMPRSFDGALGITGTRAGENNADFPTQSEGRECIRVYEAHTGRTLDPQSSEVGSLAAVCGSFRIFVEGAGRAGADLTAASFSAGLRTWTSFVPVALFTGSFGPAKFDAGDATRLIRWSADCTCFTPVTDPSPTRF